MRRARTWDPDSLDLGRARIWDNGCYLWGRWVITGSDALQRAAEPPSRVHRPRVLGAEPPNDSLWLRAALGPTGPGRPYRALLGPYMGRYFGPYFPYFPYFGPYFGPYFVESMCDSALELKASVGSQWAMWRLLEAQNDAVVQLGADKRIRRALPRLKGLLAMPTVNRDLDRKIGPEIGPYIGP